MRVRVWARVRLRVRVRVKVHVGDRCRHSTHGAGGGRPVQTACRPSDRWRAQPPQRVCEVRWLGLFYIQTFRVRVRVRVRVRARARVEVRVRVRVRVWVRNRGAARLLLLFGPRVRVRVRVRVRMRGAARLLLLGPRLLVGLRVEEAGQLAQLHLG